MNLVFNMNTAVKNGILEHPQKIMEKLGITYLIAVPMAASDSWWFWCCENVPENLPDYIYPIEKSARDLIGWGMIEKEVDMVEKYYQSRK